MADESPAISKRTELINSLEVERQERGKRCMAKIDAILADENCKLLGKPMLRPTPNGAWEIVTDVGVIAS